MEKSILQTLRKSPAEMIICQLRKNHALEHASIHVLETKYAKKSICGYSIHNGFWLMGQLTIQEIQEAVDVAIARLQNGEKNLAIHPGCGTNLAVTGFCTAFGAMLVMSGANSAKKRINRFPELMTMSSMMVLLSRPLGFKAQKYVTTDPDVSEIHVVGINASELFGNPCFFVQTNLAKTES